jgi:hypothetical protein
MKLTEQVRQRTYNVTLWLVYVTIVAMKTQQYVPFVLLTYT